MGTTCLLLWGGQCQQYTDNGEQRVLEWIATVLGKGGAFPDGASAQVQPLFVLAYEAALLAGHKIDDDSEDGVLARKSLLSLVSDEKTGEEKKKRKRPNNKEMKKLRRHLKIDNPSGVDMKAFVQTILGTNLADKTYMRFGIDPSFNENDEPSPIFLYDGYKIKKAYGTSYQRVSVDRMKWKDVPTALDRWAYFKMVRLLGLVGYGMDEKPNLIISMYVPPSKNAFGGAEYDY